MRRGARHLRPPEPFVYVVAASAVLVALIAALAALAAGPGDGAGTIRLVHSSGSEGTRALVLSTASLYAENDPWRDYLATESVCPGGERTDLPASRQLETLACLVNFARKRRGLRELPILPLLNAASTRKASAIIRCTNFAHNPCGGDWRAAVRSTGYRGEFGENLYVAGGPFGAPRVAVDAWLNSASHRRNLFSPLWRVQGFALLLMKSFEGYRDMALWVSVLGGDEPSS
jgi:uncharacterized protein YkwD